MQFVWIVTAAFMALTATHTAIAQGKVIPLSTGHPALISRNRGLSRKHYGRSDNRNVVGRLR